MAKTPSHPLYGIGDPSCFSVDGVAGSNISVYVGRSYGFQAMNLPTDYSLYISTSDVGAGAGQLSPHVAGDESLIWTVALPPPSTAASSLLFNSTSNATSAANSACWRTAVHRHQSRVVEEEAGELNSAVVIACPLIRTTSGFLESSA